MLPKNKRISKDLFAELLKKGVVLHSPLFSFRVMKEGVRELHVSFVVSKKTAASAVDRNKMKRRGYSAVRNILKTAPVKTPFVGAFFCKKGALVSGFKELQAEILSLFRKTGIL